MAMLDVCDLATIDAVRVVKLSAKRLRERRQALGLSVADLAREFYVLTQTIYRWEREDGPPRGLVSIGADVVLKRLEAEHRRKLREGESS